MKKIQSIKAFRRGREFVKNALKYFTDHPDGIKKEEYFKKMRAKHDYCWYRNHEL